MKIIVCTNIIFSALIKPNSTCAETIHKLDNRLELYGCRFMRHEIMKHWQKIKKISKLPEDQLHISYEQILSKLKFINEDIIPSEVWLEAEEVTKEIDIDDSAFVAMSIYLKAALWTGDKTLYNGLKKKDFKNVLNTQELLILWENISAT